jgi:hypothetical protein
MQDIVSVDPGALSVPDPRLRRRILAISVSELAQVGVVNP